MFNLGILTISDKAYLGERCDESSQVIRQSLSQLDFQPIKYEVIPDQTEVIASKLKKWADDDSLDIIFTTGGTGLAERDVTPEATLSVLDKIAPGFVETMRAKTAEATPFAILSRAVAGIRGNCLIINLPGSAKAVAECLEVILPVIPHALEIIKGTVTEHVAPRKD